MRAQVVRKSELQQCHSHTAICVKTKAFINLAPWCPACVPCLAPSLSLNCPVLTPQLAGACNAYSTPTPWYQQAESKSSHYFLVSAQDWTDPPLACFLSLGHHTEGFLNLHRANFPVMVPVMSAKNHFMKLQSGPWAVKTSFLVCGVAWFRDSQGSGVTEVPSSCSVLCLRNCSQLLEACSWFQQGWSPFDISVLWQGIIMRERGTLLFDPCYLSHTGYLCFKKPPHLCGEIWGSSLTLLR